MQGRHSCRNALVHAGECAPDGYCRFNGAGQARPSRVQTGRVERSTAREAIGRQQALTGRSRIAARRNGNGNGNGNALQRTTNARTRAGTGNGAAQVSASPRRADEMLLRCCYVAVM